MKTSTILYASAAAIVGTASAQEIDTEFSWTVSSEYMSYLQNNVCATGECAESDDPLCANNCSNDICQESCNDASGSSEFVQFCNDQCCPAAGLTDCTWQPEEPEEPSEDPEEPEEPEEPSEDPETPEEPEEYVPDCVCIEQDGFPAFNVLLSGDLTQSYVDIEGNAAVGGNADITGFGVGVKATELLPGDDGFVVGGDLSFLRGTVYYGLTSVGGDLDSSQVDYKDGIAHPSDRSADLAAWNAQAQETSDLLHYNSANSNNLVAVTKNGSGELVFDTEGLSTGEVTETETFAHYFSVKASDLASASGIHLNHANEGDLIVIDVEDDVNGEAADLGNMGFFPANENSSEGDYINTHTLWNFNGFSSLSVSGVGWRGSIVAPAADIAFNGAQINGAIFGKSLTGNGESHHFLPEIDNECVCETPAPTPEPDCPCIDDVIFPLYNLLVAGDADITSDIEGNMAVCGDLTAHSFSIGNHLADDYTSNEGLLVGGDLTWNDGEVDEGVTVYGGSATPWAVTFHDGISQLGSAEDQCNSYVEEIIAASDEMHDHATQYWAGYENAAAVTPTADGSLVFETEGMGESWYGAHLFTVKASDLEAASSVTINHANGDEFVIIDVEDDVDGDITLTNFGFYPDTANDDEAGAVTNTQTVWNFNSYSDIEIDGLGWRGAIVAPTADMVYNNGQVLGSIYVASFSGNGEVHYWPIAETDKDCVCPTLAPTSAPTPAPNCYDDCEAAYLIESGTTADSCGMYSSVIVNGCSICSDDEMTDYVDNCLNSGCAPEECGCQSEDVVEIEESVIVVPATVEVSDCPETEEEIIEEFTIEIAAALDVGCGDITDCTLSTSRRLSDGSTQLSFNVVVNSNEQGSRQIANKIEGLTSLGDMNVDSVEVDECDESNCVSTITSYTVAEDFEYDESNYAAEGASNSGMAAGVVGAVGACALVVGAAVAAKKRGYFAAAMKSEEVVTENPVREAELV